MYLYSKCATTAMAAECLSGTWLGPGLGVGVGLGVGLGLRLGLDAVGLGLGLGLDAELVGHRRLLEARAVELAQHLRLLAEGLEQLRRARATAAATATGRGATTRTLT